MLRRSLLREIKSTLGRYLAIFAIIALGVGFFTGLRVCTDAMRETADRYLHDMSLYDFRLISTVGLTGKDVETFSALPGIKNAAGSVTSDFMYVIDDSADLVMRAHTMTEGVNGLDLISGRMPEAGNECLMDAKYFGEESVGTVLTLSPTNSEETLDMFTYDSYTVVGLVNASYYVNFERGTTSLGDGKIAGFIYMPPEGMENDYFTEVFLTLDESGEIYSDEYENIVSEIEPSISKLLKEMADERYASVREEAEQKLADAEDELDDGRRKFEEEKHEAEQKLEDARIELKNARNELDEGLEKIKTAKSELAEKKDLAAKEFDEAQEKLETGKRQLASGENQLKEQRDAAEKELSAVQAELDEAAAQISAADAQLSSLKTLYDTGTTLTREAKRIMGMVVFNNPRDLVQTIASGNNQQVNMLVSKMLGPYGTTAEEFASSWLEAEEQIDAPLNEETIEKLGAELYKARSSYNTGLDEFNRQSETANKAFAEAEAELVKNREQIEAGEKQLADSRNSAYASFDEAEKTIEENEKALSDGEKEYAVGLKEYEDSKAELAEKMSDAESELAEAELEVADARQRLRELTPTTYVLDRNTNIGYASLENDMGIVRGVSKVFPLFFFFVAALVCITTMTRMVDEQRTQNGVLMALGYGNWAIVGQYLFYAGSASVLGCFAGFLLGSRYMPMAIWQVYKIMYSINRPVAFLLDWKLFFACMLLYLLCSLGATYLVCRQDLKEAPANLIRPKAPPAGSHILIERVKFVWKRVKFLHKVSIRNILRYKKRMVMMILGVGGCTALLLAGFGIRDSIQDILIYQYGEIEVYDASVTFMEHLEQSDIDDFTRRHDESIDSIAFVHLSNMDFVSGGKNVSVNAVSFKNGLDEFIDLHCGSDPIGWPGIGETVIDYRLAAECGIHVGDTVIIRDPEFRDLTLTVSGIFDNYIYDYAFINEETFADQWGEIPIIKTAFVNTPEEMDVHAAAADILGDDSVANVNVLDDMRQRVGSMLESLDYIVLIVLICAGALAFIVLYNLTNISINERRREIATLKVLGFYRRETAAYVFRENLVLTGISALFGLPMGYALLWYVMKQIKISSFYFPCRAVPLSYILAFLLTFVFAGIVALALDFKLEKIEMADSLKAVE